MPWVEIPLFIKIHLRDGNKHDVTRPMLEFLILTAARSGSSRGMKWSEVDFAEAIWIVLFERKAKLLHRVLFSTRY